MVVYNLKTENDIFMVTKYLQWKCYLLMYNLIIKVI